MSEENKKTIEERYAEWQAEKLAITEAIMNEFCDLCQGFQNVEIAKLIGVATPEAVSYLKSMTEVNLKRAGLDTRLKRLQKLREALKK